MWISYERAPKKFWISDFKNDSGTMVIILESETGNEKTYTRVELEELFEVRMSYETDVYVSLPRSLPSPACYSSASRYLDDFRSRCAEESYYEHTIHSIFVDGAIVIEALTAISPTFKTFAGAPDIKD